MRKGYEELGDKLGACGVRRECLEGEERVFGVRIECMERGSRVCGVRIECMERGSRVCGVRMSVWSEDRECVE